MLMIALNVNNCVTMLKHLHKMVITYIFML
jgi:hypothetical protein